MNKDKIWTLVCFATGFITATIIIFLIFTANGWATCVPYGENGVICQDNHGKLIHLASPDRENIKYEIKELQEHVDKLAKEVLAQRYQLEILSERNK